MFRTLFFYVIFSILFALVTIECLSIFASNNCERKETKSLQFLGTKTPYRVLQNSSRTPYTVPGCKPQQLWMFIRHGTRFPSSKVIFKMSEKLPRLRDEIVESHLHGKGKLCSAEVERLRAWAAKAETSDEKRLCHEGEDEMSDLAERMLNRFPDILDENYSNHSYKFRYTATQRTRQSAQSFADGLFGRRVSKYVWYPEALKKDPILRFYKLCTKWLVEVDDTPETLQERRAFERSAPFVKVQEEVARRLGLPNVSVEDVILMYMACGFESAWHRKAPSPWCAVFSEEDLQVLEYTQDLTYYWNDGYGFDVNHKQACPAVMDMLQSFQDAIDKPSPKGIFHFSHSGALLKILAHLGLYRDEEPLLHSNFATHRDNRKWRVGRIDGFGSNLASVLYKCDSGVPHRVLLLHQERAVTLPGCDTELCPLDTWRQLFPDCSFHHVCHRDTDEL